MSVADSSILTSLEHHAIASPNRPFLLDVSGGAAHPTVWSYAQTHEIVEGVAAGLQELGVARGDRVVLRLANSSALVAGLLGTMRLGAIAVPTIRQYSLDELRFAVEDCGAVCVIADDEDIDAVAGALPSSVRLVAAHEGADEKSQLTLTQLAQLAGRTLDAPVPEAGVEALIFYTSGTTSRPKGVVLTHGAIAAASLSNAEGWRISPADRGYIVLPLFHCNALFMQLVPLMLAGGTAVLDDRFSASRYLQTLRVHSITLANLTAGAIRSVMAQPEAPDDREHGIRLMTFGLPLHEDEIRRFEERFGVPMVMCYGLTETAAGGTRTPFHLPPCSSWQSVGTPQSGWDVRILGEDSAPLPLGTVGEIALRGPGIMERYWNNPEATAEVKRTGWLHTGDLGRLEEHGYLYFVSRKKDMLKPRGENVAASEVEQVLEAHPAVVEAAVIGVFDPHREESIVAFVAVQGTAPTQEELRAHCAQRLAAFKVPAQVVVVADLPRTSIGKVNKGRLRKDFEDACGLNAP